MTRYRTFTLFPNATVALKEDRKFRDVWINRETGVVAFGDYNALPPVYWDSISEQELREMEAADV